MEPVKTKDFLGSAKGLPWGSILLRAAIVVAISSLVGIVSNMKTWVPDRKPIPWVRPKIEQRRWTSPPHREAQSTPQAQPTRPAKPLPTQTEAGKIVVDTVELEQAYDLLISGQATFVDARTQEEFDAGHIAGALSLPSDQARDGLGPVGALGVDRLIVTYCDGGDCEASIDLGQILKGYGYTRVVVFFGGWEKWKDAGYPTEEPKKEGTPQSVASTPHP